MGNLTNVYIGTSGWVYKDWHKDFYPKEVKKDFLRYFSKFYNSVEVNNSFYRLPSAQTFQKWYDETPPAFRFAVKMSRYITHIKQLKAVKREVDTFLERAVYLKEKLGVILVQLPPSLSFKKSIVKKFFSDIASAVSKHKIPIKIALEPRNESWFNGENLEEVKKLCMEHNIALVFAHSSKFPSYEPEEDNITSDFVYLRMHGPDQFAASLYGAKGLKRWASLIAEWVERGITVFAYFNNDIHGYAIKDARILASLVEAEMNK